MRGKLAEHVTALCAQLNPSGAEHPYLVAGLVDFVFALNCTSVNLKPLNAMSIQLAEVIYSRFVPPLLSSLETSKAVAALTVLGRGVHCQRRPRKLYIFVYRNSRSLREASKSLINNYLHTTYI